MIYVTFSEIRVCRNVYLQVLAVVDTIVRRCSRTWPKLESIKVNQKSTTFVDCGTIIWQTFLNTNNANLYDSFWFSSEEVEFWEGTGEGDLRSCVLSAESL